MNKYARMLLDKRKGGYDYREEYPDRDYYNRSRYYEPKYDRRERFYDDSDREPEEGRFRRDEAENWKHRMLNEDGTVGEHFKAEQLKRVAESQGIHIEELGGFDTFSTAVNMMYSDYCSVAKKYGVDRIEFYADMAKAFLKDRDFDGLPEDKLYLYYKCIVEE